MGEESDKGGTGGMGCCKMRDKMKEAVAQLFLLKLTVTFHDPSTQPKAQL